MSHVESFYYLTSFTLWMGWNVFLAGVAVGLGHLVLRLKSPIVRLLILPFLLLFLPNTLYMVTDGIHVYGARFLTLTTPFLIIGVIVVAVVVALSVFTFYYAVRPVMLSYRKELTRMSGPVRMTLFGFVSALVGIAITMGRFQRTNSWYVFTQPQKVFEDLIYSFSHVDSMLYVLTVALTTFILMYLFWNHLHQLSTKRR